MLTRRIPVRPRKGGEGSGASSAWDCSGVVTVEVEGVAAAVARGWAVKLRDGR